MSKYMNVPCDAVIANGGAKRKDGQPFVMYWKNRRNAQIATKLRLKYGVNAEVLIDTETMSVVTDASILRERYTPIQNVSQRTKRVHRRLPKGLRYAKR